MLLMVYKHLRSLSLKLDSSPYVYDSSSQPPSFNSCFRSLGFEWYECSSLIYCFLGLILLSALHTSLFCKTRVLLMLWLYKSKDSISDSLAKCNCSILCYNEFPEVKPQKSLSTQNLTQTDIS